MTARLLSDVAEIGLSATSTGHFERQLLERLIEHLGADGGCVHVTDAHGRTTIESVGHSKPKEVALVTALNELEADELVRRALAETVRVSPNDSRYDRLSWFHAYRRIKAYSVIGRLLATDALVMGVSLSRSILSPFSDRDVETLDAVFPVMKIGEELQRRRASSSQTDADTELGLGGRESQITELVCKGLQNPEIAQVLGISPNTVRNNLVNVFRKLGVTTRSELVMICTGTEARRGPARLADGLKRRDNPARGLISTALGWTKLASESPRRVSRSPGR
jgi:DNA-binding CsgD family transcriptional regulator